MLLLVLLLRQERSLWRPPTLPKDALAFWFSNWANFMRSICSWMAWMDCHWSVMDWPILEQNIFLTSARVLSRVSSFSNYFILFSRALTSLSFLGTFFFYLSYFSSSLVNFSLTSFNFVICSSRASISFIIFYMLRLGVWSDVVAFVEAFGAGAGSEGPTSDVCPVGGPAERIIRGTSSVALDVCASCRVDSPYFSFNDASKAPSVSTNLLCKVKSRATTS